VTTVTAIVLSYNRPKMLREALESVAGARPDQTIVVDDGSTFDVSEHVRWHYPQGASIIKAYPIPVQERLVTPRLGKLINAAIQSSRCDVIAYLCDDDLWINGWLDTVREYYAAHPETVMVRGEWRVFQDADGPQYANPLCPLDGRQMTTGNFAHRRDFGARWPEDTVLSHDDRFLWDAHAKGVDTFAVPCIGFAGYRREHAHNALHHANVYQFGASGAAYLSREWLEE
jgi:glycosyltransferase involved in cell wall biosynthesis